MCCIVYMSHIIYYATQSVGIHYECAVHFVIVHIRSKSACTCIIVDTNFVQL